MSYTVLKLVNLVSQDPFNIVAEESVDNICSSLITREEWVIVMYKDRVSLISTLCLKQKISFRDRTNLPEV